jgi:hypothetical protein
MSLDPLSGRLLLDSYPEFNSIVYSLETIRAFSKTQRPRLRDAKRKTWPKFRRRPTRIDSRSRSSNLPLDPGRHWLAPFSALDRRVDWDNKELTWVSQKLED